ncbi:MAG: glycosyltransferase family 87 protein [Acidobacteriota bacterium]|nr:glycosyltransferase family 87 protein [Acidobacteriota bacterium]MDQ7087131.1 glycosyltransferase family 87 protein [Acidobacteriota bacterium]
MTARWRRVVGTPLRETLAHLLLAGSVVGGYVVFFGSWRRFVHFFDHGDQLFYDFVYHYMPMAEKIATAHGPVAGYFYPPLLALLLEPLTRVEPGTAMGLWALVQVLSAALPVLVFRLSTGRRSLALMLTLLQLTSFPLLHNFKWGQVSTPLAALVFLAAGLGFRGVRGGMGAVLIALATALKYYTGLLALPFVLGRRWSHVMVMAAATAAFLFLLPAWVMGPGALLSFYGQLTEAAVEAQSWVSGDPNSQALSHVVLRRLYGRGDAAPRLGIALTVAGGLVVAASLALIHRRRVMEKDPVLATALLLAMVPFVVSTSWPHYFAFLPLAQVWVFHRLSGAAGGLRWIARVACAASVVVGSVLPAILLGGWKLYGLWGLPLLADLLLLVGLVIVVGSTAGERRA